MDSTIIFTQLAGQAPIILIYVVSIIFCLVFIKRYPLPAVLALLALGLGLLTLVGHAFGHAYLLHLQQEEGWEMLTLARALGTLNMAASGARALVLALLVAAVFIGRKPSVAKND